MIKTRTRKDPHAPLPYGHDDPQTTQSVPWTPLIFGAEPIPLDDPTELYHEASRSYPGIVDTRALGAASLEASAELRVSAARSVKRHHGKPFLPLPKGRIGRTSLAEAIAGRRSARGFGARPLSLSQLASLLRASYGVTGQVAGTAQHLRAVPSGGALFPLELYVAAGRVDGVEQALFHYDPLRDGLERLDALDYEAQLRPLSPYADELVASAAVVVVSGVFWRSRFKYGARAYRFTLIEAGHVAQNFLLTATALRLTALPIGGFHDRAVDRLLGADSLHEAALYLLAVGAPA